MDHISRKNGKYNRYSNKTIDKSFKNKHANIDAKHRWGRYYEKEMSLLNVRKRRNLQYELQNLVNEYNHYQQLEYRHNNNLENSEADWKQAILIGNSYKCWYPNCKNKTKQCRSKWRSKWFGTTYDGNTVSRRTKSWQSIQESFVEPLTYCNLLINPYYRNENVKNTIVKAENNSHQIKKNQLKIKYRINQQLCCVLKKKLNNENHFKLKMEIQKPVCYRDYIFQQKQMQKSEEEQRKNELERRVEFEIEVTLQFMDGFMDNFGSKHQFEFGDIKLVHVANADNINKYAVLSNLRTVRYNKYNWIKYYCSMHDNQKLIYLANIIFERRINSRLYSHCNDGFNFKQPVVWNGNAVSVRYNTLFEVLCDGFGAFVPKCILKVILVFLNMEYYYYYTATITGKVVGEKVSDRYLTRFINVKDGNLRYLREGTTRMYQVDYSKQCDMNIMCYTAPKIMLFDRELSREELAEKRKQEQEAMLALEDTDEESSDLEQMKVIRNMFDESDDSEF